jgi:hypothetical protein
MPAAVLRRSYACQLMWLLYLLRWLQLQETGKQLPKSSCLTFIMLRRLPNSTLFASAYFSC